MNTIGPCLCFDSQAEEAAAFYMSIFKNSAILETTHYLEEVHRPKGSVLAVKFVLDGQEFLAINGGPQFRFTPAISFVVNCATQEEIDDYWEKLSAGGQKVQCGWLTDKFGVSWQIVPSFLPSLFNDPDTAAAQRVFAAMLQMQKLDIAALQRAYAKA
ncbi:MAG TPA: VOC family protein [Azonexus sp.]|nr:VOC family protein [Azonexus sp.]